MQRQDQYRSSHSRPAKAPILSKDIVDTSLFEILADRPHMLWLRSIQSGDEFVLTNFRAAPHPKNRGLPYHVFHRHPGEAECHYHANERNLSDAMRHIVAHDRKAIWRSTGV